MADRNALARATEGTDAPTPGYLYVDIAKSAASSPVASTEIVTYLTRRLSSKNNHNIKYKCLKVLTQTATSPVTRGQFKRAVCQDPSAVSIIKECLNFRGPPDAARGDEIYARVRTAAKECLDAIYSDTPSSEGVQYASGGGGGSMGGVSGSYGASPYSSSSSQGMGGPGGGGGGARKMDGIGNPMYKDPRMDGSGRGDGIGGMTIGEVAAVAGETIVGMIKDPLAKNVEGGPPVSQRGSRGSYGGPAAYGGSGGSMPGYGGGGVSGSYGNPPGRNELAQATGGQWTMASNRGPNAVGRPQNFNSERDEAYFKARDGGSNAFQWAQQSGGGSAHSGVPGGSWGAPATSSRPPASPGQPSVASQARAPPHQSYSSSHAGSVGGGRGGAAASDGSYERNLITELCPPGGMRAEPPPDKLEAFARAVPSLDPDLVCPALLDALEDGQPWIIKAKALCVMETTIRVTEENGTPGSNNAYADFFHACAAEIEPLATHARAAIRDPAKRVLRALGLEVPAGAAATPGSPAGRKPKAAAPAPVPVAPNLLDFGDDDAQPAAAAPEAAPPVSTPTAPPPTAAPPPPTAPAANDASGGSLFGGLTVQSSGSAEQKTTTTAPAPAAPGPAPTQAPPPPPAPSDGFEVLLGNAPTPATPSREASSPAPATSGGGGLFGDMSIKDNSAPKETPPETTKTVAETAAANGSAFGFMNGGGGDAKGGSGGGGSKDPATPTKENFDPLLSTSSASMGQQQQQQAMQMNAQQMQAAMAYQHNMMMMQKQYQMQMAIAMQQGGAKAAGSGRSASFNVATKRPSGGMNPNVMGSNSMRQIPVMGGAAGNPSSFSFLDGGSQAKKESHEFDFVKDAMKDANKK